MLEREEVLKLAKLSRLSIAEEDIPAIKGHLDKMLDHLEALKALDLSNVEPMTAVENGAKTALPSSAKTCRCRVLRLIRLLQTLLLLKTITSPSRR